MTDALKFRMELLQVTTESQAKRALMQLSAACKWGMKHRLIESNPLDWMYLELNATTPPPPMAFTAEERDRVIKAFKNDDRNSAPAGNCPGRNHHAPTRCLHSAIEPQQPALARQTVEVKADVQ